MLLSRYFLKGNFRLLSQGIRGTTSQCSLRGCHPEYTMGCHPIEGSSHHRGVPSKSLLIALFPPAHVTCLLFKAYPSSRSPLGGSSLNQPSPSKTIQLSELKSLMSVLLGLPVLCFCMPRLTFGPLGRRQIWGRGWGTLSEYGPWVFPLFLPDH